MRYHVFQARHKRHPVPGTATDTQNAPARIETKTTWREKLSRKYTLSIPFFLKLRTKLYAILVLALVTITVPSSGMGVIGRLLAGEPLVDLLIALNHGRQ